MEQLLKLYKDTSIKCVTPDDGKHYFFGYYDLQPFDKTGRYHLTHRVEFMDRLPEKDDIAEIGIIDCNTCEFHKIGDTTAWNFQQGALLHWYGDEEVMYNVRTENGYGAEIRSIDGNLIKQFNMPFATASDVSKIGISINFERIYDFRAGYGYAGKEDPFFCVNAPENDGVFKVDLETGEKKLIISYADIVKQFPEEPYTSSKLLVNHINLNPKGDRFVFLLRNFPEEGKGWNTQLIAGDLEGNMIPLTNFRHNSHYCWKNDREVLIVSDYCDTYGLWLFDTFSGNAQMLDIPNQGRRDIHCIYSPNKRYVLGDAYPDAEPDVGYRCLMLYDSQKNTFEPILSSLSTADHNWDIRADLHSRFDKLGKQISFDASHNNKREIYVLDTSKIIF